MHTPNCKTSKCMRPKLIELKKEIEKSTSIVGGFKTPLSLLIGQANRKLAAIYKT